MSENAFMLNSWGILLCFILNLISVFVACTSQVNTSRICQQVAVIDLSQKTLKFTTTMLESIIYVEFARIIVIKLSEYLAYGDILTTMQEGCFLFTWCELNIMMDCFNMLPYLIMAETLKIFVIICLWGLKIAILGLSASSPAYHLCFLGKILKLR